ncbi:hypothetical protein COTS27_00737 [Spirochaetota bacterium]|nr:hypothetical protein COTS27_00737 [Spirochaetota bacterium]
MSIEENRKATSEQVLPMNLYEKRGVDFAKKDVHRINSECKERHNSIYKVYGKNTFAAAITGFWPDEDQTAE